MIMSRKIEKGRVYRLIEALAGPRIDIIMLLSDGKPRYVSEIANKVGLSRTATAYHLDVLEDIGIVEHRYEVIKEPSSVGKLGSFYRINREKLKEILEALEELQKVFTTMSSSKV